MAVNAIRREVDANANIIFGSAFNENMKGKIRISVVATGIDSDEYKKEISKIQDNHEPSRFNAGFVSEEKHNKGFFDPGVSLKPQKEEIAEIVGNIQARKSNAKEESQAKLPVQEEMEFQEDLFLEDDIENDYEDEVFQEEVALIEEPKSRHFENNNSNQNVKKKKENSGFNLFGFMNNAKAKILEEEPEIESIEEEVKIVKKVKFQEENHHKTENKRRESITATIFDEDSSDDNSQRLDDDILNVPAFFRRKK
jgi:hypothetical protein